MRNGWVFIARASNGDDGGNLPAFPTICAHCGIDRESYVGRRAPEDAGGPRSSIRTMGTGYEKANQIFNDALLRSFGAGRGRQPPKLIVFSDSRQDAARQSIGIEHAHYLDTIRQVAVERIRSEGPLAVAYDHEVLGMDRGAEGYEALEALSPNDRRRLGEARRGTLPPASLTDLQRDVGQSRQGAVDPRRTRRPRPQLTRLTRREPCGAQKKPRPLVRSLDLAVKPTAAHDRRKSRRPAPKDQAGSTGRDVQLCLLR